MIDFYYWFILNGKKVIIFFEECGMFYCIVQCVIGQGDQFEFGFLVILLNNCMLVMVDFEFEGGGELILFFELGVIMMYLVEKVGWFYLQELCQCYEVNQWFVWQMVN